MSRIPRVPTAIVAAAALLTAGLAVLSFGRNASAAQETPDFVLASSGLGNAFSYRSAISSDGRYVAYQSIESDKLKLRLRDVTSDQTFELPTNDTEASTPSVSGDAGLVSFIGDVAGGTQSQPKDPDIYVVDRRTPDAPKVKPVTETANDLPYQRMVHCAINTGDGDDSGCEPQLSRDGTTLVAPVVQSVDSPRLSLGIPGMNLNTDRGLLPMMDNFYLGESTLTVTNNGTLPIVYPETGPMIEGPGFSVKSTTCANTLAAGASCTVTVHSDAVGQCGSQNFGQLRLPATTSGGQTAVSLLDFGQCLLLKAFPPSAQAAAAPDCTGPSQYKWGLPIGDDPTVASEGHPIRVFGVGAVPANELGITALNIQNYSDTPQAPLLTSPGCQLKLVLPADADPATSCKPGEPIAPQSGCTAYVEYMFPDVAPFLGTLRVAGSATYRISGHATRRAVAAWRDPGAAGNFGPAQLVSVQGTDNVPMDATGPTVSANGRWVGFTSVASLGRPDVDPNAAQSPTQVYLHDTDADGDGTHKPGQTVLASLKADGSLPLTADEGSVSDDGSRIAFTSWEPTTGAPNQDHFKQVYVRDRATSRSILASAGPDGTSADEWTDNPRLSGDGGTVVYRSGASNLGVGDLAGGRIIARDLTKDLAGGRGANELISVRADGLGRNGSDRFPSVSQDGTQVAFASNDSMLTSDNTNGDNDPDVYHARRAGSVTIAPVPLDFGTVKVGATSGTQPLTLTNDGLAPVRFAKPDLYNPREFSLAGDQCTGMILRPGQSCSYLLTFHPAYVGPRSERFAADTDGGAQPTYVQTTLQGAGSSDARTPGETSHVSTNEGRHTDPSISDNGQFVAYKTSPENPDAPAEQINVKDQATKQITQFASHDGVGPTTISADGTRVGYNAVDSAAQPGDGKRHRTMVADKAGAHPISGTETDLRYQRYAECNRREAGDSDRQCRPALSGDGKTIAYPAHLDPRANWLKLEVSTGSQDPVDVYDVIDFGTSSAGQKLTVTTDRPIRFTGPPTTDPDSGFIVADGSTCTGVLEAGASCTAELYHQACGGKLTGVLRLHGATPDGQTAIPLMSDDTCIHLTGGEVDKPKVRAADCAPIPPAPYTPYASGAGKTNADNPLVSDSSEVGTANYMATVVGGVATDQTLKFQSGCDFGLVQVTEPDPDKPKPCVNGQVLPANTTCTAVIGFRPEAADVSSATLYASGGTSTLYRFTSRGFQDVVLTRTDPAGDGSFSGPVRIGSRDDAGQPIDGTEPSLSADGRYLAFASSAIIGRPAGFSDQVYRRDLVSGRTILVSQMPDGEVSTKGAFAPSLSASGDRVAFVTDGYRNHGFAAKSKPTAREAYVTRKKAAAVKADDNPLYYPSEVWARDIGSGKTVLVSAASGKPTTEGDGFSWDPSLSDDGSTVGYTSTADDLVTEAGNNGDAIYVRNLDPDFSGAAVAERFNERVSLTADGAVPQDEGDSDAAALSSDGAFTAFDSTSKLAGTDTDDYRDVYVRRRPAQLVIEPVSVNFGGVQVGKTSSARELMVRNLGPGPVAAGPSKVDPPFAAGTHVCKVTLHRGESCTVDARFVPVVAGTVNGVLTLPSTQGYLAGPSVSAGLTGTGTTVPPVAGFSVVPGKLAFGSSEVGKAGPASKVTLRNTGQVALSVAAGLTSAGDFGVDDTACTTLMPGATCDFPVSFVARKAGARVGSILFRPRSQDPLVKSPADVTVGLSGVGVGKPGAAVASMTVTPKLLVFGPQILTTASAPQAVVVTNTGNVPLNVSGLTAARDFTAATAVACRTLLPGQACQVAVRFVPRALGTQAGAVMVSATATGAAAPFPALVRMSGATAAPTLVVEPPVVRPGQIVLATGTNFPPGQAAVLAWKNGLGTQKVVADQAGRFQDAVLVFRRDVLGQRFLTATMAAQPVPVLSAPVLVMPLGPQPPNFVLRW
ncbi:choice-of-anchor D domain-containing protein [Kribbella ginsengisoli]|uniref:HYDIN/VesB/CFA65-like Ig-like domain-containing protein n=1 Tax=Kribbella ginsengisoli TaxID=363865 RepID=A0ABP6YEK9_9ACTN